jgi:predicted ATP-binding protein involved in virulence
MRDCFPNLQVVTTTHSPLIVAGLRKEQVTVLRRDPDGKVVAERVQRDMVGMRADQLLTSELFGLSTTRDPESIHRYSVLLHKDHRTLQEEAEFKVLETKIAETTGVGEITGPLPSPEELSSSMPEALKERVKEVFSKRGVLK